MTLTALRGSISIVSHGHGALMRALLDDLSSQQRIADWLVIVTLNIEEPFDEGAWPALRLKLLRNSSPLGFGANHNAAARHAEGALFAIVNPDIRLMRPDTLVILSDIDWSASPPPLRAPTVVNPDGVREDSVRLNLSLPNLLSRVTRRSSGWEGAGDDQAFFWLAGMFLVTPLNAFVKIGGFDERFRLYCEDYDLSARWRISGGAVKVIENLAVIHDAQRDSHRSWRHLRWHLSSLSKVWLSRPFWRIVMRRYPRASDSGARQ